MINNSYLLGLFGTSTGTSSSPFSATTTAIPKKKTQPTAPWASTAAAAAPKASDMVRAALAGRRLINESAVDLDLAGASADYRKLFALYQGLNTLSALADRASAKGLSSAEAAQVGKRFEAGLAEMSDYLKSARFEDVRLVQGVSQSTVKTGYALEKAQATFVTTPIHDGALSDPVKAFQGDVKFAITIKTTAGSQAIDVDLSDMGDTPRTMDNVIAHINGKLDAAGVSTRLEREMIQAQPKVVKSGSKTITLPAGPDQWALKVRGGVGETVGFKAVNTSDAVYVTQGGGTSGAAQLLKFQADGGAAPAAQQGVNDPFWVEGRAGQTNLPDGVAAVRSSAVAPDGSIWVVADLTQGAANQPIKGARDVALLKYDSAGNLMQTKLLGAASTANGFSIAVDADGRVAVAGSVTGALEPGKSGDAANTADSFVTVFDNDGKELWTQRRGARAADEATEVSFGADGMVYVAGRSKSAMSGQAALGGWDSYLQTFQEKPIAINGPDIGVNISTLQFGTSGDDSVQAMTVSGADVYTAGVEDGRAIVRRFTLDASGVPTLAATRDLGLASGSIAGISVENGKVVLTGQTDNPALNIGTTTNAHAGGTDVFVATLSTDLQAAASDRLTYFGGTGNDTAADVKIKDGKVWITGTNRDAGAAKTDPTRAYLARLDLATGAVEYNQTWRGEGDQVSPTSLSIVSGGASVLDRLGLPQGEIMQEDSKLLTVATSARVGDQFSISPAGGGRAVTVTIEAKDTLDTLAKKIMTASNRQLKATVITDSRVSPPVQRLQIVAADNKQGAVISAGAVGKDALAALGLSPGFVGKTGDKSAKTYGLNLPNTLNLNDSTSIKAAIDALAQAMTAVRSAYRSLGPQQAPTTNTQSSGGSSTAYQKTQAANFQAALNRLLA
ncbi:MAG: transcriptional regulator [Candidatus Brevundimonas colombiensis]|uniref:Transcriptional regulator n=1 Tax=Candidatus Brevundimonas colombiensis TaxID=3121376 RepID=A0AAJ5X410_9CAUL|nr:transcriptional regulator [Brevundimonas sp.]WEK39900.1 MAG: transcriptional regulator [Brevundimonas sp.]